LFLYDSEDGGIQKLGRPCQNIKINEVRALEIVIFLFRYDSEDRGTQKLGRDSVKIKMADV